MPAQHSHIHTHIHNMGFQYANGSCNHAQPTPGCTQNPRWSCRNHTISARDGADSAALPSPALSRVLPRMCRRRGWDAGAARCPVPTSQPNAKLCRATPAWKHPFSLLFKREAPSHKRRRSRLQKVSVRALWPALNRLHSSARPPSRAAPSLAADSAKHRARARYKSLPLKGNI